VVVVTGAGHGLGRATAEALARQGAAVALLGRTPEPLTATAERCAAYGNPVLPVPADVARRDEVEAALRDIVGRLGPVDVLVNNAGTAQPVGLLMNNDPAEWIRAVEVNLFGAMHCARFVLPGMTARRSGRIINLSGGGATRPLPGMSAYAASKSALVRLTETLAEEVRAYGVRVNSVAPGVLPTRMLEQVADASEPDEDAIPRAVALISFLASDDAGSLTGKLISAVHDPWTTFDGTDDGTSLFTLRRIDPYTVAAAPVPPSHRSKAVES
jgi:NAD(P)-dependent dehydrogenase (short-subunit alcohol dehydrogenase family)